MPDQILAGSNGSGQRDCPSSALLCKEIRTPRRVLGGVVCHLVNLGPHVSGVALEAGTVRLTLGDVSPVARAVSAFSFPSGARASLTSQGRNGLIPTDPR